MRCSECGEREATHQIVVKRGDKEVSLGTYCSSYCRMIIEERVNRWPDTYINSKFKEIT